MSFGESLFIDVSFTFLVGLVVVNGIYWLMEGEPDVRPQLLVPLALAVYSIPIIYLAARISQRRYRRKYQDD